MTQNRKKQFGINVVSSWFQQGIRIVVSFFMLPYAMNRLGQEAYGIYQLAFSAIVFFNFLQIGMGPSLVRFATQALTAGDNEQTKKISSNSQLILNGLGFLGMLGILILIPFFIKFYNISENLVLETNRMITCMAVSFLFSFLSITQQSLLQSANRYELSNGIMVIQTVMQAFFAVLLFEFVHPSLFFYGIAILAAQGLRFFLLLFFVFREIGAPALFSPSSINYKMVTKLVGFSLLIMVQTISYTAVFQGPSLLIGKFLGPDMVALFAPALLVATAMQGLIGQSLNPIITIAAQEKTKSGDNKLGLWALQISQIVAFAGFGFLALFFLFGNDLVGLWLGFEKAWLWKVVAAVSFGAVLMPIQGVIGRLAIGASNIKATAFSMAILACAIFSGIILGMVYWGWDLFKVALFMGICISIRSFYICFHYSKDFKYSFRNYFLQVYFKTAMVSGAVLLFSSIILSGLNLATGFLWLLIQALSIGGLYLIIGWYFLLPESFKVLVKR